MKLNENWRRILGKSWSLRLVALIGALQVLDAVLPLLGASLPAGALNALSILAAIGAAGVLPFGDLPAAVTTRLPADFDGSIGWYTTTVKLDLEARGLIERVRGQTPQHLRLAAPARGE